MNKRDRKALFDSQTDRVGVDLVRIAAKDMQALYLCRNTQAVSRKGKTYLPCAMEVSKPTKGKDNVNANLKISGVEQKYLSLVQGLPPSAKVHVEIIFVFMDAPDNVVDGPYRFLVEGVKIESAGGMIELELAVEDPLSYIASLTRYESEDFPAIWT